MLLNGYSGLKAVFDAEVYPNYVLLRFQDVATGDITAFRITPEVNESAEAKAHYYKQTVVVTYNGHSYDDHILWAAFDGRDCAAIHAYNDELFNSPDRPRYSPFQRYNKTISGYPLSIDLAQIVKVGWKPPKLKELGLHFGYPTLQELPVAPGTILTPAQVNEIDAYNLHDLAVTRLVLEALDASIEGRRVLGEQRGVNLTSRADGPLGEYIIETEYARRGGARKMPRSSETEWITGAAGLLDARHSFTDPTLQALLKRVAGWTLCWKPNDEDPTKLDPPTFKESVVLGGKAYSFGMGGLHSTDEPSIIESDDTDVIFEIDASSFYPLIIKNKELAPSHLNQTIFCETYSELIDRRLEAKRDKKAEVAAGLKIVINAVYGKFSDPRSPLCDPPKGATVTLNGQFILLRLIELMLGVEGLSVLSANTDGVMVKLPRNHRGALEAAMAELTGVFGGTFEQTEIKKICRIDINNYVLSYNDDAGALKIKARGAFNTGEDSHNLAKKTSQRIIKQAAHAELLFGTPVADTIRDCRDINAFADYSALKKGWYGEDGNGNRLPQSINRWYEANQGVELYKVGKAGKRVRYSQVERVRIINNLPDTFPDDINYDYYIAAAQKLVDKVRNPKIKRGSRSKSLDKLSEDERAELDRRKSEDEVDVLGLRERVDLEHYRGLYLDKYMFNSYDSMRGVLLGLWKTEGVTKVELKRCYEIFDSTEGYFEKSDKRKSILRHIDWLVENVVPFEKEVLPEDDADMSVTVKVLDGEPGGGKTRYALKRIINNGPQVYWWAISIIDPIASEREAELLALAQEAGVVVDFCRIDSKADGQGRMKSQIDRRVEEINAHPAKDETIFVTLITHRTLIDHYLCDVGGVLYIDEPTQVWDQRHFDFPASFRTVRELFTPLGIDKPEAYDSDDSPQIKADTQAVRLALTEEGWAQLNDPVKARDTIFGGRHRWIIEQAAKTTGRVFVLAEQWNALDDPEQGGLDVLTLLHPSHIAHFQETWMMAAYFEDLLVHKLWGDLYDVTWQFETIADSWERQVPLSERVTLYYLLENRPISDTYLSNERGEKHRRAMARAVADFFGKREFIWSINEKHRETGDFDGMPQIVTGADGNPHSAYLRPRANGINCYQNIHGAAWLGSIKLPPNLLEFLQRIWGRANAKEYTRGEFEHYACVQFLARVNSRRFDSQDPVQYVVADREQAEYVRLKLGLPDDRVLPLPMGESVKADLDDLASKGRGRKATKSDDERREYQRQKSASQRKGNNPHARAADAARKRAAWRAARVIALASGASAEENRSL